MQENESQFINSIPEKCRDCPSAKFFTGLLTAFPMSDEGPGHYLREIEEYCDGYDIAPADINAESPKLVEKDDGNYYSFPKSTAESLARCAMISYE